MICSACEDAARVCEATEYPGALPDVDGGNGRGWFYQRNILSAWNQARHRCAAAIRAACKHEPHPDTVRLDWLNDNWDGWLDMGEDDPETLRAAIDAARAEEDVK